MAFPHPQLPPQFQPHQGLEGENRSRQWVQILTLGQGFTWTQEGVCHSAGVI